MNVYRLQIGNGDATEEFFYVRKADAVVQAIATMAKFPGVTWFQYGDYPQWDSTTKGTFYHVGVEEIEVL